LKIAFLTPEYPHPLIGNSGGIGTSIWGLAHSLASLGNDVRVLVYGQTKDDIFSDSGVLIQQIENVKFKGLSWFLTRKKIESVINRLYSDRKIDLVEAPDWTGITSFIQTSCPIVIRLHGSDTYFCHLDNRPVKWFNRYHEKRALAMANGHISVSQYTADTTNKLFGLKIPFKIIPNGVDASLFFSKTEKNSEKPTILYFGTIIRKKGVLELPSIFSAVVKQIPNAQLLLIGKDAPDLISGNSSTWALMASEFSAEAKANVSLVGAVPYGNIVSEIQHATVCIFPSFAEALPLAWLEAMASKKAMVVSNIGWANEMLDDCKSAYLVNPRDHQLFASRIIEFIRNSERRQQFGDAAQKKILDVFDFSVVAHQNIEFYNALLLK